MACYDGRGGDDGIVAARVSCEGGSPSRASRATTEVRLVFVRVTRLRLTRRKHSSQDRRVPITWRPEAGVVTKENIGGVNRVTFSLERKQENLYFGYIRL